MLFHCFRCLENWLDLSYLPLYTYKKSAIEFCHKDLSPPQFKGSEKTVQFIRMVDQMFDYLNSKNPNQKFFKSNVIAKTSSKSLFP